MKLADQSAAGDVDPGPLGVYVHIPFCSVRCDYCAFATWTDRHQLIDEYLDALRIDIARTFERRDDSRVVSTVFVGGGTPSLVPPEALAAALAEIPTERDVEMTVECNPDDVDDELLAGAGRGWGESHQPRGPVDGAAHPRPARAGTTIPTT